MTRLISFRRPDGLPSFGRLDGDTVHDLGTAGSAAFLKDVADQDLAALPATGQFALADVRLLPVVPNPGKILCVGLNYTTHVAETGREQKEFPAIFTRWADTLIAAGEPLVRPRETERFDYEGELAVVIGKGGRRIARADAMAHVAGFSIFNDGSARDWQRHNIQFTPGKNYPATGAFGPALVLPDEVADLGSQRVQTRLNGELVQDQPISDMIWDIPFVIEYCSTFTPLAPGDVIVTGTPGGVGDKRKPPLYMKAGDVCGISIGVIGTLTNPVIDEI
ncbi:MULTISPECIES: fumarylacetoacetate hydrolase family protein [unclassified Novosphingobium]|uniref:fumarylacetoacetate hydrolase family protein n=1 Tax=unclassified Novosphingobium TaxID=2644732 RepID=UPI0014419370|nr:MULTISPECIES: fumarylacetoacetate hydrolase family protein [unclassified Novosphingobium]MBB3359101.1 2-keto-4-pentenoate hydratase/2-oxohepta-3-ene-1,7-dioic acid hydratase in catechol pathway [Novosphingobium sp. BK256]MBB3375418.1 2-keto-4-pentenoate hydratase/2-oxohepta-3-ene-1,7-dioic acid hydratase in catechol pathway [Novosphingobium sp. BK280]MBB3379873.1 2-keto-4-pentenoate hydratase/2-oxohepta-3-ene-1,7-dioic acid hydratase in catechol pathway [Novosphingobium sp. BK258]MBB3421568.